MCQGWGLVMLIDIGQVFGLCARWFAITLFLALGCSAETEESAWRAEEAGPKEQEAEQLEIVFAGCHQLTRDGICVLGPTPEGRDLSFWVGLQGRARSLNLTMDDEQVKPREIVQGLEGWSFQVRVPLDSKTLNLELHGPHHVLGSWSLSFSEAAPCVEVKRALQLRSAGKSEEALKVLAPRKDGFDAKCELPRLSLVSRLYFDLGDYTSTKKYYERAIAKAHAEGDRLARLNDTIAFCFVLFMEGEYSRARNLIESLAASFGTLGEFRARLPYYRGIFYWQMGDFRNAERHFDEARFWAERLNMTSLFVNAVEMQAVVSIVLGREKEVIPLLRRIAAEYGPKLTTCEHAMVLASIASAELQANDRRIVSGLPPEHDPFPGLMRSRELLAQGCGNRNHQMNVVISLALAQLQRGDIDGARTYIEEATTIQAKIPLHFRTWLAEIRSRVALKEGDPERALKEYRRIKKQLAPLAEGGLLVARGEVLALMELGQVNQALRAYYGAEQKFDDSILTIPIDGGRGTFASSHMGLSSRFVEFLFDQGRIVEAFEVARRSRARAIRTVSHVDKVSAFTEQDRRWWEEGIEVFKRHRTMLEELHGKYLEAASDEQPQIKKRIQRQKKKVRQALDDVYARLSEDSSLSPRRARTLRPNEVLVLYYPVRRGWLGFARSSHGVQAIRIKRNARFSELDEAQLSSELLAPFQTSIRETRDVTFLVSGELEVVDFHGLPFGEQPLGVQKRVAYALDVPRAAPRKNTEEKKNVLIIADPSGNLASAETEVRIIRKHLKSDHQLTVLRQGASGRGRVETEMANADLVHFAGHALFAGQEGWSSRLMLADDEQMNIGDILALRRVPRQTVLVACESGRSDTKIPVQTMGVGQAFVAAGSDEVVITSRSIDNNTATAMTDLLYRQGTGDLVEALFRSSVELYNEDHESDWKSFRAVIP